MNDRVRQNTPEARNDKVDLEIRRNIERYAGQDQDAITRRIRELDREWSIERALEVNMPVVALIGLALAAFVSSWWLILPAVVLLFFLQHAIQGWCPPLPLFRALGFRTRKEIDREKYSLKLIRGDFDRAVSHAGPAIDTNSVYKAVSM